MRAKSQNPAVEYLSRAWGLDAEIDAKLEQIQRWRALAERRSASYAPASGGSRAPDGRMDIVAKIVDAEKELDKKIERLMDMKQEIADSIDRVPDDRMRLLLEMRYINGSMWKEIAEAMNYSERNILKLHEAALKVVTQIQFEV